MNYFLGKYYFLPSFIQLTPFNNIDSLQKQLFSRIVFSRIFMNRTCYFRSNRSNDYLNKRQINKLVRVSENFHSTGRNFHYIFLKKFYELKMNLVNSNQRISPHLTT